MPRSSVLTKKYVLILSGLLLIFFSILISKTSAWAQPACEFDCINDACCPPPVGVYRACNGGTFAGLCPVDCAKTVLNTGGLCL